MSYNDKKINKIKSKRHEWKLIDDYSGFQIYSSDAVINPEYGHITTKKEYDPPMWDSLPPVWPEEFYPNPIRPQQEHFTSYERIDFDVQMTWDTDDITWDSDDTNWEQPQWLPAAT